MKEKIATLVRTILELKPESSKQACLMQLRRSALGEFPICGVHDCQGEEPREVNGIHRYWGIALVLGGDVRHVGDDPPPLAELMQKWSIPPYGTIEVCGWDAMNDGTEPLKPINPGPA